MDRRNNFACIDTPVIFKGNKTNYLSLFEKKCKEAVVEEENEKLEYLILMALKDGGLFIQIYL